MWEYLAFINPDSAIAIYNSFPGRDLKFGISDAQTYHWLHSMSVLGRVDASLTADYPLAAAFKNNGEQIYVAHNYGNTAINVTFSDGYVLTVPANSMATSKDISIEGELASSFTESYPGGSVDLILTISGGTPSLVEFVDGETLIGQAAQAPYTIQALNLGVGKHSFYARIYDGNNFSISNLVTVTVGEQLPYLGNPTIIPGSLEAGHYDIFEGGIGQGISYVDMDPANNGDFRESEYVDASLDFAEGAVVGWIAVGEWMEYTVDVQQPGNYSLEFRYACGNQNGGGPFRIESDGVVAKAGITVNYSGDWSAWTSKTVSDVPLKSGKQVLRLFFNEGELNLGEMTFSYSSPLSYDQPIADAGNNILVQLPANSTTLDGSNSSNPGTAGLTYTWEQIYGPTTLTFTNSTIAQPGISTLEEGVYLIKLTVDNGTYADFDEVYVISSVNSNVAPKVSIFTPTDNSEFLDGETIQISALASDLNGNVVEVKFYVNNNLIATSTQFPYETTWNPSVGQYSLTAVATDNDGSSTTSEAVHVTINPAPPCYALSSNGEFYYEFSPDDNNPTLTFIPTLTGMGSPTCILYYGTNPGAPLPGYPVTPNVPYQLNASEGTLIYFYYTYSYPGQGEHNNSANKDSYVIGSCQPLEVSLPEMPMDIDYYPNPVSDILHLNLPAGKNRISVYDCTGKLISIMQSEQTHIAFDMADFDSGIYIFRVKNRSKIHSFKIVK